MLPLPQREAECPLQQLRSWHNGILSSLRGGATCEPVFNIRQYYEVEPMYEVGLYGYKAVDIDMAVYGR